MNLARVWAVADKEMRYVLRDPRSLGVSLLLPVALLALFAYAINFDVKRIALAVYDPDRTPESRDLAQSLTATDYFRVTQTLPEMDEAERALADGTAQVALIIPRGFAADLAAGREVSIQSIINGSDSLTASVSLSYLEAMIQDWTQRRLSARLPRGGFRPAIAPKIRVWFNEDLSSVNFITPGLVAVILMLLAALLTSQTVVRERERGTMEGLVVSPITPGELILGKLLPYMALSLADVAIIALVGRIIFDVPLRGNAILALALTFAYLVAALGAGLLISVRVRSQQLAYMVAFVGTLLPTLLLTGFVFPVSSMPTVFQGLVQLHPATHFMVIARGLALKGAGLAVLWPRALALSVIAAALIVASIRRFEKTL